MLTSEHDDLGELLRGEFRGRPASAIVGQHAANEFLVLVIGNVLGLRLGQPPLCPKPPRPPASGALGVDSHPLGLERTGLTGSRPQDERNALREAFRQGSSSRQSFENALLAR
ncbi:MAG TPA: hypothetical protein VGQ98_00990 [Gemmatimonadaceae bacterium]|nr:hypothetical protein [Gemmatimonadaceae bacterium]